jgi:hypothetical protein
MRSGLGRPSSGALILRLDNTQRLPKPSDNRAQQHEAANFADVYGVDFHLDWRIVPGQHE